MAEIDTYFKAYSVLHNRSDAPMITVWLSKSLAAAVAEQPDCISCTLMHIFMNDPHANATWKQCL